MFEAHDDDQSGDSAAAATEALRTELETVSTADATQPSSDAGSSASTTISASAAREPPPPVTPTPAAVVVAAPANTIATPELAIPTSLPGPDHPVHHVPASAPTSMSASGITLDHASTAIAKTLGTEAAKPVSAPASASSSTGALPNAVGPSSSSSSPPRSLDARQSAAAAMALAPSSPAAEAAAPSYGSSASLVKAVSMPATMFCASGDLQGRQPSNGGSRGRNEFGPGHGLPQPSRSSVSTSTASFSTLNSSSAGPDGVLARSSVPYSEVFPIKDQQVGPHHFRRIKLLGRGGIGRVFLVQLKGTSLLFAMKVLTKEEMIQRNKVKRVMTEREILATANHPFVVTMYASFQTKDTLCFVMEYCAGGEFFKVLQRQPQRRLREDAVRFYAAEVLLALEYLHHMGFIYRDLKPENILLRANGHIALTDFDLSKQAHAVSPRVVQHQLSMSDKIKKSLSMKRSGTSLNNLEIVDSEPILPYSTNSFVGTEDYISPEIINGVAQSSAVDWWTLGILIYEMLTGTTPFKGGHADETFSNIVNHQVRWPEDLAVSADCKHLVKRLLRREPDKRLGSLNGASDIKRAKWFSSINFALVRNETPPIIPRVPDPKDLLLQQGEDVHETEGSPGTDFDNRNPNNPFEGFDIRRDSEIVKY